MFWGLVLKPNKLYTQIVEKSFHVSMASLDVAAAGNEVIQVKLCYDGITHLLCSLNKEHSSGWQVPLDLNFQEGTKIAFACNGRGCVHLSGYFIPEENLDMDELDEEEEEDDEEAPQLVGNQPKRKAQESLKEMKSIKRLKAALNQEESSDDDLDNDDDEETEESLGVHGEANNGNDDESDDEDDEDDDEDEDEDDSENEEEEKIEVKPQTKKNKQKEQQQSKKQDKQKLVNGNDVKQDQTKQQQKKGKGEQQQQQNNAQQVQKKRVVAGGVQVEDIKVGNGAVATPGKFISVYYVGRLKNGKKFDATQHGDGFKFRLGKGEVIKGWDVGLSGMKIGGKRRITIPPAMAYGAKGSPPTIPGNSTLLFEVELKNVH